MRSIRLIRHQPRWRVYAVHLFAKAIGVLAHVEGFPCGSTRLLKKGRGQETEVSGSGAKGA
jgi:hypothetical protein